jgi:hypothetical protein
MTVTRVRQILTALDGQLRCIAAAKGGVNPLPESDA